MTDCLEELLDRLAEPERPENGGVELETGAAWRLRDRQSRDEGREETNQENPMGRDRPRWDSWTDGRRKKDRITVRRQGTGDPLERMLEQSGAAERADGGKAGGTAMRLPPATGGPALTIWTAAPGDGVAALECRVARSVVREPGTARTAERVVQVETGGGWMGLEELDRSVERDARRYDGGMRLY